MAGRTLHPCALCAIRTLNGRLVKAGQCAGCDFIATGHYANVYRSSEWPLCNQQGPDGNKDRSYVYGA